MTPKSEQPPVGCQGPRCALCSRFTVEQDDNFEYCGINLYGDTVRFYVDALRFYGDILERDLEQLAEDPDLRLLLDVSEAQSPVRRELDRTKRASAWLDTNWDRDANGMGAIVNIGV